MIIQLSIIKRVLVSRKMKLKLRYLENGGRENVNEKISGERTTRPQKRQENTTYYPCYVQTPIYNIKFSALTVFMQSRDEGMMVMKSAIERLQFKSHTSLSIMTSYMRDISSKVLDNRQQFARLLSLCFPYGHLSYLKCDTIKDLREYFKENVNKRSIPY